MSDEEKKESSETPGQQETAPQAEKPEDVRQEAAEPEKAEKAEKTEKAEKAEKGKKESHKKEKEKTYTLTREQMEAAELAAKQLAAVKEQFVRLTAEYDNYRKRTAREKDTIYQDAKADTIEAFLAVYDNLERALATDADPDSPHRKGMEMIFNQYKEILKKLGVTEMEAKGQPFDPNRHNAVMHIDDENLGENVVSDVFQAGFLMGDRVLRFATVRVAN
jgi:molecular chaperone GrpE